MKKKGAFPCAFLLCAFYQNACKTPASSSMTCNFQKTFVEIDDIIVIEKRSGLSIHFSSHIFIFAVSIER
jgi:hypothetical protein